MTAEPEASASVAPASVAPPAPITAAPATEAPPKWMCTVFVIGPTRTTERATMDRKQFVATETTRSEHALYTKELVGEAVKRGELCDAFARRKCPAESQGNAERCRYAVTEGETAEWDTSSVVPAP